MDKLWKFGSLRCETETEDFLNLTNRHYYVNYINVGERGRAMSA